METTHRNQIVLLSDIPEINQMVREFCVGLREKTYQVVDQAQLKNPESCIMVLVTKDKAEFILHNKHLSMNAPLIYLSWKNETDDELKEIKKHVDEIIDMHKITAAGFIRAITSTMEKFYIKHELSKQQEILKELIGTIKSEAKENKSAQQGPATTQDLIEQNKLLIETIQKQNEELKKLARVDILTKVGNRLNFDETLTRMIAHAKRHKHMLALLMIDLDKFKNVNDTMGHQAGDLLLQAVAQRLQNVLRQGDFVARMGGDEFAVVLNEIKSPHAAGLVSWKILRELNKPVNINGVELKIEASVGIACYPLIGDNFHDLLKNADIAMYQAKKSHMLKYAFASLEVQSDHVKKVKLEEELKSAIKNNELTMVYQPIYAIPECTLHGFEALIRWESKNLGKISPADFIPIAEDSGLIHPITTWVLETVFEQIALWEISRDGRYKICINLSPSQLTESDLIDVIRNAGEKNKVPLSMIEFEITEMAALQENKAASNIIKTLCELGASHALDDFGTGFSSIKHLRLLPISTIKIDQSFVQGLGIQKADESIVSSIISLAKKMGMEVVAEGVETQEQLDALMREKCDYIQGYFFSKPLSASDALALMHTEKAK